MGRSGACRNRLFAFGLVGIFVGPVMLAVGCTLLEAWMGDGPLQGPEYRD